MSYFPSASTSQNETLKVIKGTFGEGRNIFIVIAIALIWNILKIITFTNKLRKYMKELIKYGKKNRFRKYSLTSLSLTNHF